MFRPRPRPRTVPRSWRTQSCPLSSRSAPAGRSLVATSVAEGPPSTGTFTSALVAEQANPLSIRREERIRALRSGSPWPPPDPCGEARADLSRRRRPAIHHRRSPGARSRSAGAVDFRETESTAVRRQTRRGVRRSESAARRQRPRAQRRRPPPRPIATRRLVSTSSSGPSPICRIRLAGQDVVDLETYVAGVANSSSRVFFEAAPQESSNARGRVRQERPVRFTFANSDDRVDRR